MRVTEESENQSAKLSAVHCPELQKLPAVHCPELHEVFEEARSAARAGDNRRAATICLQGIQRFGEEPTLTRLFKEACARLSVTPSLRSYPSGVLLLTATQLLIGDSLPVCYRIQPPHSDHADALSLTGVCTNGSAEAPVESAKDLEFLALFHADFQADESLLALLMTTPSQLATGIKESKDSLQHNKLQSLPSPSTALCRVAVTKLEDSIALSGPFLRQEGRFIVRYYHEQTAMWPSAQVLCQFSFLVL